MTIEMECLICGNHDHCDPTKLTICDQCDNGLMVEVKTVFRPHNYR